MLAPEFNATWRQPENQRFRSEMGSPRVKRLPPEGLPYLPTTDTAVALVFSQTQLLTLSTPACRTHPSLHSLCVPKLDTSPAAATWSLIPMNNAPGPFTDSEWRCSFLCIADVCPSAAAFPRPPDSGDDGTGRASSAKEPALMRVAVAFPPIAPVATSGDDNGRLPLAALTIASDGKAATWRTIGVLCDASVVPLLPEAEFRWVPARPPCDPKRGRNAQLFFVSARAPQGGPQGKQGPAPISIVAVDFSTLRAVLLATCGEATDMRALEVSQAVERCSVYVLPHDHRRDLTVVVAGGRDSRTLAANDTVAVLTCDAALIHQSIYGRIPDVAPLSVIGDGDSPPPCLDWQEDMAPDISFRATVWASRSTAQRSLSPNSVSSDETPRNRPNPFDVTNFIKRVSQPDAVDWSAQRAAGSSGGRRQAPHRPSHTRPTESSRRRIASFAEGDEGADGAVRQTGSRTASRDAQSLQSAPLRLTAILVSQAPPAERTGVAPFLFKYDPNKCALLWFGPNVTCAMDIRAAFPSWRPLVINGNKRRTVGAHLPSSILEPVHYPLAAIAPSGKLYLIAPCASDDVFEPASKKAAELEYEQIATVYIVGTGDNHARSRRIVCPRLSIASLPLLPAADSGTTADDGRQHSGRKGAKGAKSPRRQAPASAVDGPRTLSLPPVGPPSKPSSARGDRHDAKVATHVLRRLLRSRQDTARSAPGSRNSPRRPARDGSAETHAGPESGASDAAAATISVMGLLDRVNADASQNTLDLSCIPPPVSCEDLFYVVHTVQRLRRIHTLDLSGHDFGVVETRLIVHDLLQQSPHVHTVVTEGTRFSPPDCHRHILEGVQAMLAARRGQLAHEAEHRRERSRDMAARRHRKRTMYVEAQRQHHVEQREKVEWLHVAAVRDIFHAEATEVLTLYAQHMMTELYLRVSHGFHRLRVVSRFELRVMGKTRSLIEEEEAAAARLTAYHRSKMSELRYRLQRQEEARARHQLELERRAQKRLEHQLRELERQCCIAVDAEERPARRALTEQRDDFYERQLACYRLFYKLCMLFAARERLSTETIQNMDHLSRQAHEASSKLFRAQQKAAIAAHEAAVQQLAKDWERQLGDLVEGKARVFEQAQGDVVRWLRVERTKARLAIRAEAPTVQLQEPLRELLVTESSSFAQPLPLATGFLVSPVLPHYMKNRAQVMFDRDELRPEAWIQQKSTISRLVAKVVLQDASSAFPAIQLAAFAPSVAAKVATAINKACEARKVAGEWQPSALDSAKWTPVPWGPLLAEGSAYAPGGARILDGRGTAVGTYEITALSEHIITLEDCSQGHVRALLHALALTFASDNSPQAQAQAPAQAGLYPERVVRVACQMDVYFSAPAEATDATGASLPLIVASLAHHVDVRVIPSLLKAPKLDRPLVYAEQSGPQQYYRGVAFTASCNPYIAATLGGAFVSVYISPQTDVFDALHLAPGYSVEEAPRPTGCARSPQCITYKGDVLAVILEPGPLRYDASPYHGTAMLEASPLCSRGSRLHLRPTPSAQAQPHNKNLTVPRARARGRSDPPTDGAPGTVVVPTEADLREVQAATAASRKRQIHAQQAAMQSVPAPCPTTTIVQLVGSASGDTLQALARAFAFGNDSWIPVEDQRTLVLAVSFRLPLSASGKLVSGPSASFAARDRAHEVHSSTTIRFRVEGKEDPTVMELGAETVTCRLSATPGEYAPAPIATAPVVHDCEMSMLTGGFMCVAITEGYHEGDSIGFRPPAAPEGGLLLAGNVILHNDTPIALLQRPLALDASMRAQMAASEIDGALLPAASAVYNTDVDASSKLTVLFIRRKQPSAEAEGAGPLNAGYEPTSYPAAVAQEILRSFTFSHCDAIYKHESGKHKRQHGSMPATDRRTVMVEFCHDDTKAVVARCTVRLAGPTLALPATAREVLYKERSGRVTLLKEPTLTRLDEDGWGGGFIIVQCTAGFDTECERLTLGGKFVLGALSERNPTSSGGRGGRSKTENIVEEMRLAAYANAQTRALTTVFEGPWEPADRHAITLPDREAPVATLESAPGTLVVRFPRDVPVSSREVTILLKSIMFENTSSNPATGARDFVVAVADSRLVVSAQRLRLSVVPVDDATSVTFPTLPHARREYVAGTIEDDRGFALLDGVLLEDPDTFCFAGSHVIVDVSSGADRLDALFMLSAEQQRANYAHHQYSRRLEEYLLQSRAAEQDALSRVEAQTAAALSGGGKGARARARRLSKVLSTDPEGEAGGCPPPATAEKVPLRPHPSDTENSEGLAAFERNELVTVADGKVLVGGRVVGTIAIKSRPLAISVTLTQRPKGEEAPSSHAEACTLWAGGAHTVPLSVVAAVLRAVGFRSGAANPHEVRAGERRCTIRIDVRGMVGRGALLLDARPPVVCAAPAEAQQVSYKEGSDPVPLFPSFAVLPSALNEPLRAGFVVVGMHEDSSLPPASDASGAVVPPWLDSVPARAPAYHEDTDRLLLAVPGFSNSRRPGPMPPLEPQRRRSKAFSAAPLAAAVASHVDTRRLAVTQDMRLLCEGEYIGRIVRIPAARCVTTGSVEDPAVVAQAAMVASVRQRSSSIAPAPSPPAPPAEAQGPAVVQALVLAFDSYCKATMAHAEAFVRLCAFASTNQNPATAHRLPFALLSRPGSTEYRDCSLQVIAADDPTTITPLRDDVAVRVDAGGVAVLAGAEVEDPDTTLFVAPSRLVLEVASPASEGDTAACELLYFDGTGAQHTAPEQRIKATFFDADAGTGPDVAVIRRLGPCVLEVRLLRCSLSELRSIVAAVRYAAFTPPSGQCPIAGTTRTLRVLIQSNEAPPSQAAVAIHVAPPLVVVPPGPAVPTSLFDDAAFPDGALTGGCHWALSLVEPPSPPHELVDGLRVIHEHPTCVADAVHLVAARREEAPFGLVLRPAGPLSLRPGPEGPSSRLVVLRGVVIGTLLHASRGCIAMTFTGDEDGVGHGDSSSTVGANMLEVFACISLHVPEPCSQGSVPVFLSLVDRRSGFAMKVRRNVTLPIEQEL